MRGGSMRVWGWAPAPRKSSTDAGSSLNQSQVRRVNACEDALKAGGLQSEHPLEQPCEHRARVRQHRIIPILKQIGLVDLDLFANKAAAIDAAAHHPIDAAMPVVGA